MSELRITLKGGRQDAARTLAILSKTVELLDQLAKHADPDAPRPKWRITGLMLDDDARPEAADE